MASFHIEVFWRVKLQVVNQFRKVICASVVNHVKMRVPLLILCMATAQVVFSFDLLPAFLR